MRILFCKWNGCCEAGIEAAWKRLGHQVDALYYDFPRSEYANECLLLLQKKLEETKYDMVFSHNFIPLVSKVCQIYKLFYISWVMDSPAYHLYSKAVENSCNRIFIFDQQLYQQFVHRNPQGIFYFPLATCVPEWDLVLAGAHPKQDYNADVSFLGSLYIDECNYDSVENVPEYLQGYMDGLIEAQLNVYGYSFLEDVLSAETVAEYAGYANWSKPEDYIVDERFVVSQEYLSKKCTQLERIRVSEVLATGEWDYRLYTNSPIPQSLKECMRGVVGYYDEMPWVFRESKINLNITAKGIRSGIPLRMMDIMGCGGFVLTNYQAELPQYFEIGKELAVYESIPHMLEQITYYLQHEEERLEIACRGYEKVKQCFTYDVALRDMLQMVFPDQD